MTGEETGKWGSGQGKRFKGGMKAAWRGETEKDEEGLQRTLRVGPEQVWPQSPLCSLYPPNSFPRACGPH